MTSLTSDDLARGWAKKLETRAAQRRGTSVEKIRPALARQLGVSAGTLENLSRDRLKRLPHNLFLALRSAVLGELSYEIEAHEHELAQLLASGLDHHDRTVAQVEAGLGRLRSMKTKAEGER